MAPEPLESYGCMLARWQWELNSGFSGRIASTLITEQPLQPPAYLLFKNPKGPQGQTVFGFKYLLE